MPEAVVAARPGTGSLPALTEGEKAAWLGEGSRKAVGTSRSFGVPATQCGWDREGGKGGSFSAPPFFSLPDAALGDAGANAELWAAADPGRGPHSGRAAVLPALPGGRGPLRAGEAGLRCSLCPSVFLSGLWALAFIGSP